MNNEIISDIRNKLQTPSLVLEYMNKGKALPESFIRMANRDFIKAKELLDGLNPDVKNPSEFII